MWPVAADPTHLALGHAGNDVGNHVWGYAWVAAKVAAGGVPDHTDLLSWPAGGSLWFIDTFGALLTLPINALWGPVAAYNTGYWFNFFLAGVGASVLGTRVSGTRLGGWLAGLCFMTTPQLLGQAYNGISETVAVGWLPLALAAVEALLVAPSVRRGVLAGVLLAVTAVANWYYGLFAVIFCIGLGVRALARAHRGRGPSVRVMAGPLLVAGVLGLLLAGPPFALFAATMSADDALVTRDAAFNYKTLILHNMTDIEALVHPGRFYSPDLKRVFGEDLIVVVYLGLALLVPAALGAWYARCGQARFWTATSAVFLLFSLGPFLYAGGDYVQVAGGWVPLPFLALFKWFPMFSRISHAYRFVVGLSLALSVLVAMSVRVGRQRGWDVPVYVVLVAALRVFETTMASSAPFPIVTTVVAPPSVLARLEGGAVLDLPVGVPILARSRFLLEQLFHGQPVPFGLNEPTPAILFRNHYTGYLLELERSTVTLLPDARPYLDVELGRAAIIDAGMRWIVVHQDEYRAAVRRKIEAFLDLTATPVHQGEGVRIYRLDEAVLPIGAASGAL
ncbi:MAG: hypothetical protein EXR71_17765 [Myxococcales bacterium]|nr:hypothetical protein [Myxococcales bacterium]